MKAAQKESILKRLSDFKDARKMSANNLASYCGVSAATMSHVFSHKWDQISNAIWSKISSRLGGNTWTILGTKNFNAVQNGCADAQENRRIVAITGETGFGKSTALKEYMRSTPNAYYVLADVNMGCTTFLLAVCRALGLNIPPRTNKQLMMDMISSYFEMTERPLLIIDDASKMGEWNFPQVQLIFDRCNIGIVLSGMPKLRQMFITGIQRDRAGCAELNRRIGHWLKLNGPSKTDIDKMAEEVGIKEEVALRYVRSTCTNYGSLREFLSNAARAAANGEDVNELETLQQLNYGGLYS